MGHAQSSLLQARDFSTISPKPRSTQKKQKYKNTYRLKVGALGDTEARGKIS